MLKVKHKTDTMIELREGDLCRSVFFRALTIFFMVISAAYLIWGSYDYLMKTDGWDMACRWRESRYMARGIDPLKVASGQISLIPEIGKLQLAGYPPWSHLYMAYTFGLLPLKYAKIGFWLFNVFLCIVIWAWALSSGKTHFRSKWCNLFLMGTCLATIQLKQVFYGGNYGLLCAAMIFCIALCVRRKFNVLAGVCWAILLIKPQLGVLFLIPFLLQKNWRAIITMAAVVFITTLFVCFRVHTNPFEILLQIFNQGSSYTTIYNVGILSVFPYYDLISIDSCLIITALAGLLACFGLAWWARKLPIEFQLAVPAVFSLIWTYSQTHNWVILFLYIDLCVIIFLQRPGRYNLSMLSLVFVSYMAPNFLRFYQDGFGAWLVPSLRYSIWIVGLIWLLAEAHKMQQMRKNQTFLTPDTELRKQ